MANNRTYFGNKITGEVIYLGKHYNDPMWIDNELSKKIQMSVNNTFWKTKEDAETLIDLPTKPTPDGYDGKCPFVFFSENIEDEEDYDFFF